MLKDKNSKILVVDDEISIRRLLETRLSMFGYEVVTAADGIEAVNIFRDRVFDLVVLDVMLPKLDGYGVCQELRKVGYSDYHADRLGRCGSSTDGTGTRGR